MVNRIHYTSCPVCNSPAVSKLFTVKDHTVSGEEFDICHCANCQLRFTQDVPAENEIGRYYKSEDYISHTNTSKGLVNRIYQLVRKRANRQKRKMVEKITGLTKGKLLDLGSGTGYFAAEMEKAGWEVTGLEPDTDARKLAQTMNGIQLLPVTGLPAQEESFFDAITLWHVLEHVHELKPCIRQLKKTLKENGRIFIAVPNYTSLDAETYREHWAAWDVPRHLYHFTPVSMKWLVENEGLKLLDVKAMWFDSFYVSLLSTKYKKGRPGWLPALWTGLRSNLKAMRDVRKCSSVIYIITRQATG